MMTYEERERRLNSIVQMKEAARKRWLNRDGNNIYGKSSKLWALNILLEPPARIRDEIERLADEEYAKESEALLLYEKLKSLYEDILTLPYTSTFTDFDGNEREFICTGLLPNFEESSTNEDVARQMLADYRAQEAIA